MSTITEKADKVIDFIKANLEAIAEENNKIYFQGCVDSYANAKELANTEEKETYLYDAATKWANQMAFLLFRHEGLSEEAVKEFRSFEAPEETTKAVGVFREARENKISEVKALQEQIMAEDKELDILKGVIAGMGVEEAKQKLAEYEEQLKQTQR